MAPYIGSTRVRGGRRCCRSAVILNVTSTAGHSRRRHTGAHVLSLTTSSTAMSIGDSFVSESTTAVTTGTRRSKSPSSTSDIGDTVPKRNAWTAAVDSTVGGQGTRKSVTIGMVVAGTVFVYFRFSIGAWCINPHVCREHQGVRDESVY